MHFKKHQILYFPTIYVGNTLQVYIPNIYLNHWLIFAFQRWVLGRYTLSESQCQHLPGIFRAASSVPRIGNWKFTTSPIRVHSTGDFPDLQNSRYRYSSVSTSESNLLILHFAPLGISELCTRPLGHFVGFVFGPWQCRWNVRRQGPRTN